jgi:hypothetical protein
VLVRIDGHADISTILHDCGLDRFHGVKVIRSLHRSGLITVGEPKLSGSAAQVSVAVRGPIDIYNEVFLTTLTDADLVKQMRVEIVDGREVEIPVVAGSCEARGVGDGSPPGEVIVYTAPAAAPPGAWLRLARESSAAVVLANANDRDSLRASRADIEFVRSLDGVPLVVAAYVSVAGEELDPRQVSRVLGIAASVPVLPCHLRDRESVLEVVEAALRLARA